VYALRLLRRPAAGGQPVPAGATATQST
jgi:hypothetical protein